MANGPGRERKRIYNSSTTAVAEITGLAKRHVREKQERMVNEERRGPRGFFRAGRTPGNIDERNADQTLRDLENLQKAASQVENGTER